MLADHIISTGLQYLGAPYVFNAPADQTATFDCSSFIQYIFGVNGIRLPRNSRQQFGVGVPIPLEQVKIGDLLFFTTKARKNKQGLSRIGHVAIYMGQGKMLHTYRPENKVMISVLDPKWKKSFVGAKRVI
ncbi:C40 family peptidase [Bacillus sp. BRMEA1]|uniref:C40 family peptidase n=1 Tax=Neobacillus endophyticus TaxID=2738405 RepID=UPI001567287D|nr:C40 family peptidase [Neobacillus endophyticus]NRD79122.1 C40 family peptidase [Neobacillus endophyticus]